MDDPNRRDFLTSSLALAKGGWLALHLPALASLAACAREASETGEAFRVLTPREGRTFGAVARRILPSGDGLPGAEEAGAVHFADAALLDHFPDWLTPVREGLARLEAAARRERSGTGGFASLAPESQDELLREEEDGPFFELARMLVVMGTFSHPDQGGNRDGAGWRILAMEPRHQYLPPFGAYDAGTGGGGREEGE